MSVVARPKLPPENAAEPMTEAAADPEADARLELAIGLAEEALDSYEHLLTPEMREVFRAALVADLLDTAEGQEMLRSIEAQPTVERSGSKTRGGAEEDIAKKSEPKVG
jgi:hypothetical protein